MTMKEAANDNIHFSVSPITTSLVFVTTLLTFLVSPSTMVLGAPSNVGIGSSTKYRFSYNTTDVFVDRVCRRVPVLLDPSTEPPCRIVDMNCIVEDPCVHPDPVERLLSIVPCPPVWEPSLVCSTDIGSNLECTEKVSILRKCFLSPNRPPYNLMTRKESCKLKSSCGLWFKTCSDEFSQLTDVFVNCSATVDVTTRASLSTNIPDTTYLNDMDNATHPTYNGDRTTKMVPGREEEIPVILIIIMIFVGITSSLLSMIIVFLICRKISGNENCEGRYMYCAIKTECEERSTEDLDGRADMTPFLAENQNENKTSDHGMVLIQMIEIHAGSNLETEKREELLIRFSSNESDTSDFPQRRSDHMITLPDISGSNGSDLENMDCLPHILSIDDDERDELLPFDIDLTKTNLEIPGTLVLSPKSNLPSSKSDSEKNIQCPVDDSEQFVMAECHSLASQETSASNGEENGVQEFIENTQKKIQCPVDDSEQFVMAECHSLASQETSASNGEKNGVQEFIDNTQKKIQCPVDDSEQFVMTECHSLASPETSASNGEENGVQEFIVTLSKKNPVPC